MKKFKLEIELGNDAMRKGRDVIESVKQVMALLAISNLRVGNRGRIADVNGNKVGSWVVEGDEDEEET